jgi:hypothetical protein
VGLWCRCSAIRQKRYRSLSITSGSSGFYRIQGVSYTTEETVLDVGPVEVTKEKSNTIPLPPVLGAVALLGGVGLVAFAGRKS